MRTQRRYCLVTRHELDLAGVDLGDPALNLGMPLGVQVWCWLGRRMHAVPKQLGQISTLCRPIPLES